MDADLELAGGVTTLKGELLPRLLEPQLAKQDASKAFLYPPDVNSVKSLPGSAPLYSAILFGPPGKNLRNDVCPSIKISKFRKHLSPIIHSSFSSQNILKYCTSYSIVQFIT